MRTKLALVGVFALSLVAFAISIVKAVANAHLSAEDFTYSIAFLQIYILVECNVIICTGSAPTLRGLWTKKRGTATPYDVYGAYGAYGSAGNGRGGSRVTAGTYGNNTVDSKTARSQHVMVGDSTSEEYILEYRPPQNNIVRTTDYHVSYEKPNWEPRDERAPQALPKVW